MRGLCYVSSSHVEGFAVRRIVPSFYRPGVYPVADAFEMVLPLHRRMHERRPRGRPDATVKP